MAEIETARLIIRPWREDDMPSYLLLAKDVGYNCFSLPGQFTADARGFEARLGTGKIPVFLKETGEIIGTCGLSEYQLDGQKEMELAYRLRLQYWEKGFATEASKAVLDDGFLRLKLKRVIAFAVPQNKPSIRVIERLGFRYLNDFVHGEIPHRLYELTESQRSWK